ncbi:MAG: hypothetical protein M9884_17140 [Rhodocyclaceae bacterium]|nr:hypothetical protein [Rhodocyclaceae bacterium]
MNKPCSKCKGEMSPSIHEPFHGEEGGLRLTISDMPYDACAQGHKRFLNRTFAAQLMDLMLNPATYQKLPIATEKGFFKKTYLCPACAHELPDAPTDAQRLEVRAEIDAAQPFKVEVDVPVYTCAGCGKACIHSIKETGTLAFKATGHAYRSIDIPPT